MSAEPALLPLLLASSQSLSEKDLGSDHQPLFLGLAPGTLPRFDEMTQSGPWPFLLGWRASEREVDSGSFNITFKGSDTVRLASRTVSRPSDSLLIERRLPELRLTVPDAPSPP